MKAFICITFLVFFSFCTPKEEPPQIHQLPGIVNLSFAHPQKQVLHQGGQRLKAPKYTLNRFLHRRGQSNLRFYNQQSRQRGIYVSKKVIYLHKDDSLHISIQGPLEHFLSLQIAGKK
ncbi:MAG: hypothetical protein AAF518_05540, partial [Spirochaetota bacterium]